MPESAKTHTPRCQYADTVRRDTTPSSKRDRNECALINEKRWCGVTSVISGERHDRLNNSNHEHCGKNILHSIPRQLTTTQRHTWTKRSCNRRSQLRRNAEHGKTSSRVPSGHSPRTCGSSSEPKMKVRCSAESVQCFVDGGFPSGFFGTSTIFLNATGRDARWRDALGRAGAALCVSMAGLSSSCGERAAFLEWHF